MMINMMINMMRKMRERRKQVFLGKTIIGAMNSGGLLTSVLLTGMLVMGGLILPGKIAWADPAPLVCTNNNQCPAGEYCQKEAGDCLGEGVCATQQQMWPEYYSPVCGCDGQTYGNTEHAGVNGVNVNYAGECIPTVSGDINVDGQVTPEDALLAFNCYLGLGLCPAGVDVNEDGQVTPADALCLFRKFLGQSSCLDVRDLHYIDLHYIDLMHKSCQETAEDVAGILDVLPAVFKRKVPVDGQSVGLGWEAGMKLINEGYEYTTTNGAQLTIWVDADDQPCAVTYLLKRRGTSADWSCDQEAVNTKIRSIVNRLGIDLSGSEDFSLNKNAAGRDAHWYDLAIKQKFGETTLSYPGIYAEIEGGTGEVNFLKIHRWYPDLNEITVILSDEQLRERAVSYYGSSQEVISVPVQAAVAVEGFYLIRDKLCKKVGGAVIDEWGSTLYLFIDVQSGEVVDAEKMLVDASIDSPVDVPVDVPVNVPVNVPVDAQVTTAGFDAFDYSLILAIFSLLPARHFEPYPASPQGDPANHPQ